MSDVTKATIGLVISLLVLVLVAAAVTCYYLGHWHTSATLFLYAGGVEGVERFLANRWRER